MERRVEKSERISIVEGELSSGVEGGRVDGERREVSVVFIDCSKSGNSSWEVEGREVI